MVAVTGIAQSERIGCRDDVLHAGVGLLCWATQHWVSNRSRRARLKESPMSIVKEIADAIELLAGVVKNTQSIVNAVDDGKEYLARNHPDAAKDFEQLLDQMQVAVVGLAAATAVVTDFRFTIGSEYARERDLAQFNKYVVKQGVKIQKLRGQIRNLKGDCEKIRVLWESLNKRRTKDESWSSMFGLLGMRRSNRREELARSISRFYANDQEMIRAIEMILELAEKALKDVVSSLGKPGRQHPFNVPIAAQMLGVYSSAFEEPQKQLNDLVSALNDAANDLKHSIS